MSEASECQWFYEKDGEEAGPMPEAELLQLLKSGQVFPDTLLWTESMVGWQPALELEPFRTALREGESVWTPSPRPWVRFWARRVDLALYEAVALGAMARIGMDGTQMETVFGLVMILAMILIEAILLSTLGTIFGKWLFNISLTNAAGEKLTFDTSLYRTFLLWLRGMAFGIPILNVLAMIFGFRNLTRNEESSWDRDARTVVRHRKVSPFRWVAAFLVMGCYVLGLTVMLWPQIEAQLEKQQKELQRIEAEMKESKKT